MKLGKPPYEPLSKLLVSPLITTIVVPHIIRYITPLQGVLGYSSYGWGLIQALAKRKFKGQVRRWRPRHRYLGPRLSAYQWSGRPWSVDGQVNSSAPLHEGPVHHGYDGSCHRDPAVVPQATPHKDVDWAFVKGSMSATAVIVTGITPSSTIIVCADSLVRWGVQRITGILSTPLLGPLSNWSQEMGGSFSK